MRAVTRYVLLALAWLAGCVEPGDPCGTGHCVLDQQCIDGRFCIDPVQRTTCRGRSDGDACVIGDDTSGACHGGICLPTTCGDNVVEGTEECDDQDFRTASCKGLGEGFHEAGTLRCRADCTVDRSLCGPRCGDGTAQTAFEQCDGEVGDATCESAGFQGGDIACGTDCQLDTSRCRGQCGDLVRTGIEVCDGADLGNQTCRSHGFYSGQLRCSGDCTAVDLSGCAGSCGDGIKNGGELCDGDAFAGRTCRSYGWYGGTLRCGDDCLSVDTAGCEGYCGDGVRNGTELCDGLDHDDSSCTSLGAMAGALGCDAHCRPTTDTCYWATPRTVLRTRPQEFASVWAISPRDIWASSAATPLVHFDGSRWRSVDLGLATPIVRFWNPAIGQLWALTSGGELAHNDGTAWRILHRDVGDHVAATSVSNIWHARAGSTVAMHFDGTTWSSVDVGSPVTGAYSVQEGTAWFKTQEDTLVHVSRGEPPVIHDLDGVVRCLWGTDNGDVYATLRYLDEPDDTYLLHYDGSEWSGGAPDGGLWHVTCGWTVPDGGSWAIGASWGQSFAIRLDGDHDWSTPISGFSEAATWVSGRELWTYTGTEIKRLDGPGWSLRGDTDLPVEALAPTNAETVWIGTIHGFHLFSPHGRYDYTLYIPVNAIWVSDTAAYLGTSAGVLRRYFDGTMSWMDSSAEISALWGSSDDDLWAVSGGSLVHYDGIAWSSPAEPPATLAQATISGSRPSNLWATIDGDVWRWTGAQWTGVDLLPTDGTSPAVRRVLTTASDDLWLFDDAGDSYWHDGEITTLHRGPWTDPVESTWGASPRCIWAVTSGRQLYHFDGVVWSPVDTGDATRPNIVAGSADSLWIGGDVRGDVYAWPLSSWSHDQGACSDVLRTYCNVTVQGHTAQAVDGPTQCSPTPHAGELHYQIEVPVTGRLRARVLSRYDVDLTAVRANTGGGCDVASCVGEQLGAGEIELDVEPGDTYFLVVGAADPDVPFTLDVHCEKE